MKRRILFLFVPLGVFVVLLGVLAWRLFLVERGDAPEFVPSVLIGKPLPQLKMPLLDGGKITNADFEGKVTLVNFFASWCEPCREEHFVLMQLKSSGLRLVGVAYKDEPGNVRGWLKELGDPYTSLALDVKGETGIDLGVTGVPESFLIDKKGVVRFKQTGPLTTALIRKKILPLALELRQ